MPNWCNNTLEISHPDIKMMRRVVKGYNRGQLLNEFIPVPPELSDGSMSWERLLKMKKENRSDDYARELDKYREELNKKYFGYAGWYEFCNNEWGTKWDVGHDSALGEYLTPDSARHPITVQFDSAWSPPLEAYQKLYDMGFSIRAYYFEGGMMYCGSWIDGEYRYFEIEKGESSWVKENIPADIDDYMGISDCMELDEEIENA
jgi:hypothetical protein